MWIKNRVKDWWLFVDDCKNRCRGRGPITTEMAIEPSVIST